MRSRVLGAGGLAAAGLFLLSPLAAHAVAQEGGTGRIPLSVTITEPEDTGPACALALSVADGEVLLTGGDHHGDLLRLTGELPTVTVIDNRSETQAAGSGWLLSGQASELSSGGATLSAGHLGWEPRLRAAGEGVTAGDPVPSLLRGGPGLREPATIASASGQSRGTGAEVGADVVLDVPVGTPAGEYGGVLTLSLFPTDDEESLPAGEDDPCPPDAEPPGEEPPGGPPGGPPGDADPGLAPPGHERPGPGVGPVSADPIDGGPALTGVPEGSSGAERPDGGRLPETGSEGSPLGAFLGVAAALAAGGVVLLQRRTEDAPGPPS